MLRNQVGDSQTSMLAAKGQEQPPAGLTQRPGELVSGAHLSTACRLQPQVDKCVEIV